MRSRTVLLAADGSSNTAIAQQLGITPQTVGKWRRRYLDQGVDGLLDGPRPGASRKLSDKDVERVLALTLESTPVDATHWSMCSLAKKTGLSRASIHRIWRAFSLAPYRSEELRKFLDASKPTCPLNSMCIEFWTTTEPTRRRWSATGWPRGRATTCTLRPLLPVGSIWLSDGLPRLQKSSSGEACIARPRN